ncbi:hypothetical protein [Rhizobium lentis]|uniref:Uncharacterized protein n=1 Tax=Rhizobium lentis TaxID=1138194 RepID=A0ABS7I9A0_9HYPH|nr:hypothetical protein [Rhizobium lentis]MBX5041212.1 hypothetical protein [Rhizobium lentis]MBX5051912.1 hypothetical protein [Rhizobium lentis]MBX5071469.1 hypothetical protein [Rhizobium lentis]MBX5088423.1 hypothetical protein [Rhizobium lentis]MBX5105965.1 hypothetical protein [Rhizobium lentis]
MTFAFALQSMLGDQAIWWSFSLGSMSSLVLAIRYYLVGRWRSAGTIIGHHLTTGQAPNTGLVFIAFRAAENWTQNIGQAV